MKSFNRLSVSFIILFFAVSVIAIIQGNKIDKLQSVVDKTYKYDYQIEICRVGKNTLEYRIFDNDRYIGVIGENTTLDTLILADNL